MKPNAIRFILLPWELLLAAKFFLILFLTVQHLSSVNQFEKMKTELMKLQPFSVQFKQTLIHNNIQEASESGIIYFLDLQHQLWKYLKPEEKYFLLEKDSYQFYLVDEKQLLKGKISSENENIFELLLKNSSQELKVSQQKQIIQLELNQADWQIKVRIKLNKDFLPERVEHIQENNVLTVYEFSNFKTDQELLRQSFALQIPPDVEIIED